MTLIHLGNLSSDSCLHSLFLLFLSQFLLHFLRCLLFEISHSLPRWKCCTCLSWLRSSLLSEWTWLMETCDRDSSFRSKWGGFRLLEDVWSLIFELLVCFPRRWRSWLWIKSWRWFGLKYIAWWRQSWFIERTGPFRPIIIQSLLVLTRFSKWQRVLLLKEGCFFFKRALWTLLRKERSPL